MGQRDGEAQCRASWQLRHCEKCQMTPVPAKQAFPSCFSVFKTLIKILSHFHWYWLGLVLVKVLPAATVDKIWNFRGLTQRKFLRKPKKVRRYLLGGKGHRKERRRWRSGPHSYSGIQADGDISTCGTQGGPQCQHLLYPHGEKERVEKAHLLLNRLGLKMTQITAIHIL